MVSSRLFSLGTLLFLLCAELLLPSCSILPASLQPETWFRSSAEVRQIRLLNVAYPLLTAAAEWCPFDQEPTYGLFLRDSPGNGPAHKQTVVAYVHPRLPAALSDLAVGDVILQVNTVTIDGNSADQVAQLIDRLTRAKIQPLQVEVLHRGERRTLALSATPACHYALEVLPTDLINGVTDGQRIGVTRGALWFFPWDDEVAWVVAHEMAHNILNHVQNAKLQAMVRAFLAARGEGADSTDQLPPRPLLESQADYVGAYLMARAGYDLSAIKRVWERLAWIEARQRGYGLPLARTHPTTKERLAALDVTLQEIEAKRRAGRPMQLWFEEGGN